MIMIFLRTGKSLQDADDALNSRNVEEILGDKGRGKIEKRKIAPVDK
ncbi:MAG TPA: hypothetical protein VED16_01065 [Candidatus Acidoferrum sp.]|nr:hypothetical protein [Candidatus Acidoferrum sp.]